MKRLFFATILLLLSATLSAQKFFYPGYIVRNTGDTIAGFIEYKGWAFNPDKIIYKKDSAGNNENTFTVKDLLGFGIPGIDRYEKYNCNISMDIIDIGNLRTGPSNESVTKEVFLRAISINPELKLYVLRDNIKERYYFKETGDSLPQELVYKIYYQHKNESSIIKIETYKNQIQTLLQKYSANTKYIGALNYLPYDLTPILNILSRINSGSKVEEKKTAGVQKHSKTKFTLMLNGGLALYKYKIDNGGYNDLESGIQITPVFGAGFDIIPDKFKEKLFIRFDINFISTKFKKEKSEIGTPFNTVTQRSISDELISFMPSFNYVVYNKDHIKIYFGAGLGYDLSLKTKEIDNIKYYNGTVFAGENTNVIRDGTYIYLHGILLAGVSLKNKIQFYVVKDLTARGLEAPRQTQIKAAFIIF